MSPSRDRTLSCLAALLLLAAPRPGRPQTATDAPPAAPATAAAAPAAEAAAAPGSPWLAGTAANGGRGIYRIEAAHPVMPGGVVVGLRGGYARSYGMLTGDDTNTLQTQMLAVRWGLPWVAGLEVGYLQQSVLDANPSFPNAKSFSLGDPTLGAKYSRAPWPRLPQLAVGGSASLVVPSSGGSLGLLFTGATLALRGLVSWVPSPWTELSVNLGYVLDGRDQLFDGGLNRAQRFAAGLPAPSRGLVGVGLLGRLPLAPWLTLRPYAEITESVVPGAALAEMPLLVSAGLKYLPAQLGMLEVMAGTDVRLAGAPRLGSRAAGEPPFNAFVQINLHVDDAEGRVVRTAPLLAQAAPGACPPSGPPPCAAAADCSPAQACVEGACVRRAALGQTFVVAGTVRDGDGRALDEAGITLGDLPRVRVGVAADGAYVTPQLTASAAPLSARAVAPGFEATQAELPRGAPGSVVTHDFVLARAARVAPQGTILAITVIDARSGAAIPNASVFVPLLGHRFAVGPSGAVEETLRAGTYQVVVTAPGYRPQSKRARLDSNSRTIFNVALTPLARARRP